MAYGLRYITNFDGGPQGVHPYTLEFHFKDWEGTFNNFTASGVPVTQSWDKDDPQPAIKGSSIDISAINTGIIPLSAFFSEDDDNCMIIYKWGTQVLFAGFLVQDDCKEIMVDYDHVINFSATDNLGLLKGVSFFEANRVIGITSNRVISNTLANSDTLPLSGDSFISIYATGLGVLIGDTVIIKGTSGSDGVYTVSFINEQPTVTFITVSEPFPFPFAASTDYTFTFITPADLSTKLPLSQIINICLLSTNLELNTNIYASIIEEITDTDRFLEETFLIGEMFLDNNRWKDCYDVLTIVLDRFNATLFQSEGVWNIIRWDELHRYGNNIPGFRYDKNMVYLPGKLVGSEQPGSQFTAPHTITIIGATLTYLAGQIVVFSNADTFNGTYHIVLVDNTDPANPILTVSETVITAIVSGSTITLYDNLPLIFDDIFIAEPNINPAGPTPDTFPINGITKSIIDVYKYTQETFEYKTPTNIFKNYNLALLGTLLRKYTEGSNTIKEYSLPYWFSGGVFPVTPFFVRSVIDTARNTEINRYIVSTFSVGFPASSTAFSVASSPIEIAYNDSFNLTFSYFITPYSVGFPLNITFAIRLTNGVSTYYLNNIGMWQSSPGFAMAEKTYGQWINFEAKNVEPAPISGLLTIFLPNPTAINELWYKDFKYEQIFLIAYSPFINGQSHTNTQQRTIKNNNEKYIFIDDTLRNSINGTMFLSTTTDLIRDRTSKWGYGHAPSIVKSLGEITTFEKLFTHRIRRTKMEGTMYGIIQPGLFTYFGDAVFTYNDVDPVPEFYVYFPDLPTGILIPGVTFTITGTDHNDGTYTAGPYQSDPSGPATGVTITVPPGHVADAYGTATISIKTGFRHLSLLTLIKYTGLPGLNFIFGGLSIDFKNNNFTGTFWEHWQHEEVSSDLISLYVFKYLYQNT